ncbi:hypothetical protein KW794_00240 [Candidatus Saccharibacteria bacterium]|nr:hypothetical protein [Candidatus Saccharibacteria bacterium]
MTGPEFIHESIADEAAKRTVKLWELEPGRQLKIVFGEGDDCSEQARLLLELVNSAGDESMAHFKVISAELDSAILRKNQEKGMNNPEMMGGELLVDFACTYRPGYMPTFTLVKKNVLSAGRHMYGWIPNPTQDNPDQGFIYHAEVLSLELVGAV